eukprot:scaffold258408_cov31-Tisochrysis_lutea.AAC.1
MGTLAAGACACDLWASKVPPFGIPLGSLCDTATAAWNDWRNRSSSACALSARSISLLTTCTGMTGYVSRGLSRAATASAASEVVLTSVSSLSIEVSVSSLLCCIETSSTMCARWLASWARSRTTSGWSGIAT